MESFNDTLRAECLDTHWFATLEEAEAAYREALKEYTRERVPLDWAMTQNSLGSTLRRNEATLRRVRKSYFEYYERSRTQLSPGKDAPISRPIGPPATGRVVEIPQVGGLHHRYERVAA